MWPFPSDRVMQGYVYILTHPGTPSHHASSTTTSSAGAISLVSIRTWRGIHKESELRIMEADADLYLAEIDGKVIVKLGPRFDVEHLIPEGFEVVAHGDGYAVWEKR
uniref:Uncharacterized protein n=1 Tax=Avena sativa TaxID=4498 RepID=A0ACD5Y7X5_AVESA